jgi:uncharacterized protein (DUF433 family)
MTQPKIPDYLDKPSGCIHINHDLSGPAMRLFNCFLAWCYDEIPLIDEIHIFSIPRKVVEDYMRTRNEVALRGWLKELGDGSVEWNDLGVGRGKGGPSWGYYKFIQEPEMRGAFITFGIARTLRGFIASSTMFARINMLIERRFKKRKYALPLYELGLDYRDNKDKITGKGCTPWMTVEQFRKYMGIKPDEYQKGFGELNRTIIQNAVKEVSAESDIKLTLEKKTENRAVTHLRFVIDDNPANMSAREKIRRTMATLPGMGSKDQHEILKYAQAMHNAFGVSLPRARKIARLYVGHEPELRAIMEKIEHDKLAGKVKGKLGAYAAAVLEKENPVVAISTETHERVEEEI